MSDKRQKGSDAKKSSTGGQHSQGLSSEQLRAQALANARAARENLGEDTVQKIAAIMAQKGNSKMEQAKKEIAQVDAVRVAEEILAMRRGER
ncbi:MAG: hypothetical protein KTR28_03340 [Micavibrio sp.]|nr:hypothetical protein [Micavibrio sp.]